MSENGNGDALRALEEIRELKKAFTEGNDRRDASLSAALGGINTKLGHIEGMVSGQAERNNAQAHRTADLERKVERLELEVATLKLDVAKAQAAGAPLQKLGYAVITVIVLGFGSMLWLSASKPASPPNIIVQMPASATP